MLLGIHVASSRQGFRVNGPEDLVHSLDLSRLQTAAPFEQMPPSTPGPPAP